MARTKISEFSATPGDNTDIDGIDIAEGCAPSGINNAIRELMSQLKDFQTGSAGDPFNGAINGTVGATTPSTVVATQVDITAQGDLRLQDTTGGQYVALQAPGTVATSYTLTLPVDDGTAGQALITDGSGVLSWSSAASGDVYGPGSATDNAVARYDGTTGKIIQNSAVTIADDGATVIAANSSSDGLRITQTGGGNALLVEDSANPDASPFVISSSGVIGQGITNPAAYLVDGFVQKSSSAYSPQIWQWNATNDSNAGYLSWRKDRAGAIVQSGDALGTLESKGYDGASYITAATISAAVDGTPGTNDMPGRLVFSTTADGASSPTERMRINNAGQISVNGASTAGNYQFQLGGTLISAGTASYGFAVDTTVPSASTSSANLYYTTLKTQASAFVLGTATHFSANQGTIGAGSSITNQYGFIANATLTGATNNYGFYGNIASGTGRWNFYAAGTADNYFAGNVGINTSTVNTKLQIESGDVMPAASGNMNTGVVIQSGGGAQAINFGSSATNNLSWINASYSNNSGIASNLALMTGATERMRVSDTGVISLGAAPGAESLRVTPVASAVNYLNVTGQATGLYPGIAAQGSDANIGFVLNAKGTGPLWYQSATHSFQNISGAQQFVVANTASAVNYLQVTGGATGSAATLSAQGSDTNIDITLTPKGTGVVTTNGGLSVTKISVTAPAAADGNVFSGTYTPTLTNTTNVSATTAYVLQYMRVGNTVHVSGKIDITPTATGAILIKVTLPIVSNFGNARQAGGTLISSAGDILSAIQANSTDDLVEIIGNASTTSARACYFTFTYRVF